MGYSTHILSKTKIMDGLQCTKKLHLSIYSPRSDKSISKGKQALFDQGQEVGYEAQKRFPKGILIQASHLNRDLVLEETQNALADGANVLFEAGFLHDGVFARVDILRREGSGAPWEIIEVKSSTSVKEEHLLDVAIQRLVLESCGLKIKSCSVMFINNQCVFPNLENLFTTQDVTGEMDILTETVEEKLPALKQIIVSSIQPEKDIGAHCDEPYECQYKESCWKAKQIPEISVFDIPGLKTAKKWDLYRAGIVDLNKLNTEKLNVIQLTMVNVTINDKRFVNVSEIESEVSRWQYPLHFLDFETFAPAIPRFDGTRPYQAIPFQFSCDVQLEPGATPLHFEYLHDSQTDPRQFVLEKILKYVGEAGSVVAYNKSVEARCLKSLADQFPHYAPQLNDIIGRLVDPLPLIKNAVYDKGFHGSFSIKAVAPSLLGEPMRYTNLAISEGTHAPLAFEEMIAPDTAPERKQTIRTDLLEYCRQDTTAMWKLADWLRNQSPKLRSA